MNPAPTTRASAPERIDSPSVCPPPDSCWPDPCQRLLLRACLGEKDAAADAYREWSERTDLLTLDPGSNRLMALLYRNLERHGIRGPHHERLKGNWRYHWYQNQLLLRRFHSLNRAMEAEGIPILALKGLPLALLYYRNIGVRPMADFDLLVPRDRIMDAAAFLRSQGYQPKIPDLEKHIPFIKGCGFEKRDAPEIDLHWQTLHDCFQPWSDERFWEASVVETAEGGPFRTLCAADQLLHTCAHGMRYNIVPPMRWLADAWMIVHTAGGTLDYDRLLQEAEIRKLLLPVRKTLHYLERELGLPAAHPACRAWRRARAGIYEHAEYLCRIHPSTPFPAYVPLWFKFRRWKDAAPDSGREFLDDFIQRKKLTGRWMALGHILKSHFKPAFLRMLAGGIQKVLVGGVR